MYHSKTKHFEVHLNYAKDMVEKKKMKIYVNQQTF